MTTKNEELTKLRRAKKRVAEIRGFYNHLAVYLVVNVVLFLLRDQMTFILLSKRVFGNPGFLENINWDVYGTPIVWGLALLIHAISVFGKPYVLGRNWEERQIQKYLEKDDF
ncbi:2TM domain-containing protein [Maribacter halichondriae]|uniref:2TM domain-containing protein n=1 Tax=Maribacter halichondriae TaxID=2980554 RepID=UPI0023599C11|nr:2TM domain-containing protein [Maribacter sp. Hal144]